MAGISLAQNNSSIYDPNKLYGNYSDNDDSAKSKMVNSVNSIGKVKNTDGVSSVTKQSIADKVSSVLAESAKTFMSGVKTNSNILLDALKNMSSANADSAVNKVIGVSSDTEAITTTNSVSKSSLESTEPIGINIHQIATTQKNGGNTALSANGNDFSSGCNRFAVDVGGKSYQFSFNNDSNRTNLSIQQQMADSINKKNIGLNAYVNYDSENKEGTLVVESLETGKNKNASSVFAVRDVIGNAASASGIDTKTQNAQNAKYSIGNSDEILTSRSNTVKIADGVTTTLRRPTAEGNPVTVALTKDTTGIMNTARNVVNGFNKLYDTASKTNDSGAAKFANSLAGIAKTYKSSLNSVGISLSSEGRLKIDDTKLKAASENGKLESLFNNENWANYGFTSRLERAASTANENPANILSSRAKAAVSSTGSFRFNSNESQFKNALNITFNPRNNNMLSAGSFFESMF